MLVNYSIQCASVLLLFSDEQEDRWQDSGYSESGLLHFNLTERSDRSSSFFDFGMETSSFSVPLSLLRQLDTVSRNWSAGKSTQCQVNSSVHLSSSTSTETQTLKHWLWLTFIDRRMNLSLIFSLGSVYCWLWTCQISSFHSLHLSTDNQSESQRISS